MTTPQPQPDMELASIFASLTGVLLTETTVATALATMTSLAADTIGHSTGAGLTLLDAGGQRITSAATDPLVSRLDDLQYQLDEGPCLTAWREARVIRSEPGLDEQNWPSWMPAARTQGMRSFLSAALVVGERSFGAIKVYSTTTEAYSDADADVLRRFVLQAAIFVSNVLTVQAAEQMGDRLKETLRNRDTVAMARGIIMARNRIGADEAFRRLILESHGSHRVLTQVAEWVVASATEG